ncbi:MAG: YnbE family lipoprotein [Myxococcota bacterium]|nr:YnbE family lipoprotein [Myxococcota bacterium]
MHLALRGAIAALLVSAALACTPKAEVQVKPPAEPIVINVNVKIEHEIRVKVDEELDDLFAEKGDLF